MKTLVKSIIAAAALLAVLNSCKKKDDPQPVVIRPSVSITSPTQNATYATGSDLIITADAAVSSGSVTKVSFYQGSTKLGEDLSSPYSYTWNNPPGGTYVLKAIAVSNGGDSSASETVQIIVKDRTELLTTRNWKITALTVNPAFSPGIAQPAVSDWYAQMQDCEKDNLRTYKVDGSYTIDEGATKCNTNDPQTKSGTWVFNPDKTILTETMGTDIRSYTILSLSSTTLVATYTIKVGGTIYTYQITLIAQ
jgi:hypothetical protein